MAIPNSFDILQAVIEATPDAIFVKDLDGRYVLVNEAFGALHRQVAGPRSSASNDLELYPEADARAFIDADRQVLATGKPQVVRRRRDRATAGRRPTWSPRASTATRTGRSSASTASRTTSPSCARRSEIARADARSAVPLAEDGSGRPADRRHRARLQQHPGDHPRQRRAAAAPTCRRTRTPTRSSTRCCARRCTARI